MQNQETSSHNAPENRNASKINQLEATIRTLIPELRQSHKQILSIEKGISKLAEDDIFEGTTEEFSLEPVLDPRTPLDTIGEPLDFDTDLEEESLAPRRLDFSDIDETDMNELDLIETEDVLNTQYMQEVAKFRELANKWFAAYHKLQPLKSDSPVLMEIDVNQLSAILKRISE